MQQLELAFAQECPSHDPEIEAMNAEAFGPGRFTRAAHLIREGGPHDLNLSFVALMGGAVVGSVRLTAIRIGTSDAILLGPLTVRPEWKKRGIGGSLMQMSMDAAREQGHKLIILVGDEPYYRQFGFTCLTGAAITMPAPIDPRRLLGFELVKGAAQGVAGAVIHRNRA